MTKMNKNNKTNNKKTKHPNNPKVGRVGVKGRSPPNTKGDIDNKPNIKGDINNNNNNTDTQYKIQNNTNPHNISKTKKIQLRYPKKRIKDPSIYHIIKHYNVIPNILRANITEKQVGFMIIELEGKEKNIEESITYLKSQGIKVNTFKTGTQLNKNKCTQCSLCTAHCPTGALHIPDKKTMEIEFDREKCIECRACIRVCPFSAIDDINGNPNTDI